jgi:hypothetical protein
MYIDPSTLKETTAARIKEILLRYAAYSKLPRAVLVAAASPFNPEAPNHGAGTGTLDRLASDLSELNNAIVSQVTDTGGYLRDAVKCICEKAPASLDRGRHYFNIYYVANGGIKMLRVPRCRVCRAVMGLSARDGIDTGFFSSGAIGMSRVMDATDVVFCVLRDAGGVYAQLD